MDIIQPDEQIEIDRAHKYIKSHQQELVKKFADPEIYKPDSAPISLFMAGSAGAGKTETSKRLIETFQSKPVRIDADVIREFVPGYNGVKAYLFQRAANKGVNVLFSHALHHNINLILDGTFAYGGVMQNIERSLRHNRKVVIYYVFQSPQKAWEMVLAREAIEHRRVSKEIFIHSFVTARKNVDMIKNTFSSHVQLNLIIKDFDSRKETVELGISSVDQYLPKAYTEDELYNLV